MQALTTCFRMCDEERSIHDTFVEELSEYCSDHDVPKEAISRMIAQTTGCSPGTLTESQLYRLQRLVLAPIKRLKVGVIIVDYQNDFVNGSLSVKNGDANENPVEPIETINGILTCCKHDIVVYSLDWHPPNHISFVEHQHDPDRKLADEFADKTAGIFEKVKFVQPNCEQVLYPAHCVQNTRGAELHPRIRVVDDSHMIYKGSDAFVDSYSAFCDNERNARTPLDDLLKSREIDALIIMGLAYDVCVAATAKDAADLGYLTAVVRDCSKAFTIEGRRRTDTEFIERKVANINAQTARLILLRKFLPLAWIETIFSRVV